MKRWNYFNITLLAMCFILSGFVIRSRYFNNTKSNVNKLDVILSIINNTYVDSVDMHKIIEGAMPKILSELDPHSVYIPAKKMEEVVGDLESSFTGIGVAFSLQRDTVVISDVIDGGPAYKVGMQDGDRIVNVNDTLFSKKGITNQIVLKSLKGPKGTKVKLGIKRPGVKELIDFDLVRDVIPQKSIIADYIIKDTKGNKFGYINISKFAKDTHLEMITALAKLQHEGAQGYIIDLRDNSGGFMLPATYMINEFLPKGKMIVYSYGRAFPRHDEYSTGSGCCQDAPLVVLINEMSASASEIFAGAIQDNDRGTIIGRRSFGKGLVQQPMNFTDGSGVRLTVARYYTPSGRCIQRPYKSGEDMDYDLDWYNRYRHGEYYSKDSIKLDSTQIFYTSKGRVVYGGGGIMPDIFVPQDTIGFSTYYREVASRGLLIKFSNTYSDSNRKKLKEFEDIPSLVSYVNGQDIVEKFVNFAAKNGVKRRNILINRSYRRLKESLIEGVVFNILGREAYVEYRNQFDNTVNKAVEVLSSTSKS